MLGRQQHFIGLSGLDERRIPRITGGTLKAGAGLHLDANDLQRHSQRLAHRTAMLWPRLSRSLKAVMDMDGVQRWQRLVFCQIGEEMKQHGGIETTGESDMPGCSVAPGLKIQQQPARQIHHGMTHIDHLAQIKCGSAGATIRLAREGA
ncbi:hypothetical protein D3C76_1075230 [compost metagenome]